MVFDTFTASNSEKGFYSCFDELVRDDTLKRVYLIKGGPGSGKSTFMKKIAEKFDSEGLTVERIHCSSDPSSLDGVKIYEKNIVIIDATAPHVYDMSVPGAYESLVDLSRFWDENLLAENRVEIKRLFDEISAAYKPVYQLLRAAGMTENWAVSQFEAHIDGEKMTNQLKKIIRQNAITAIQSKPTVMTRLLSAHAKGGALTYSDTTDALCDEYVVLEDGICISHLFLAKVSSCFNKLGYDTINIKSPLCPDKKTEQVIIPQLRLGFISLCHLYSPQLSEDKIIKKINTRTFVDKDFCIQNKNKLTFSKKLTRELICKAALDIDAIKAKHDILEKYYIEAMDFNALNKFTEDFIARL